MIADNAWAGGAVGAGVVIAVFGFVKLRKVKADLRATQAAVEAGEGRDALSRQAAAMRARLTAYGTTQSRAIAKAAGEDYLERVYGLSQQRIQSLQQISDRIDELRA